MDKTLFYMVFVLFVYFFVTVLFGYVAPFVIAFLLSIIAEPVVKYLNENFKIPRWLVAFFYIILLVVMIGIIGTSIVAMIFEEARAISDSMPKYLQDVSYTLNALKLNFASALEIIPEEFHDTVDSIGPSLMSSGTSFLSGTVRNTSTTFVKLVPGIFFGFILCLVSTFFFIKDKVIIATLFLQKSPPSAIRGYRAVKKGLIDALGGYIRAQLILMSITATISITGLAILKYPYALFVGLLIALVDAMPILGSGFVLWPWTLFCAITGDYAQALGLLAIYSVITVTRQSLEPKVLGNQIGIHPLVTLMAIFIGLKVFGPLGFLIGPVVVVTIKAMNRTDSII